MAIGGVACALTMAKWVGGNRESYPHRRPKWRKMHGTPFFTIVYCILINCHAVQINDDENLPESRVDFPDFSGDYCLTSTNHGFG